jgi:hypothetical protein
MSMAFAIQELARLREEAIGHILQMSRKQLKAFLAVRRKHGPPQALKNDLETQASSEFNGAPSNDTVGSNVVGLVGGKPKGN